MRLIDADALHEFVEKEFRNDTPYEWAWALTVVDHAPTIDAVEVVRCKECRMYEENPTAVTHLCRRELNYLYAKPDGFCSYGERKTE